jgi:pyruvate kinase
VHLATADLALRAPTDEDLVLAEHMALAGVEFIALSFARSAGDVEKLRAVVLDRARIMAKIETASALTELAEIAEASDAVMVARGDLGIDCPLEDVPHLQKQIIRHCVEVGTPVVTATQMLESMIDARSPTRAEVSDVANAVFDGTDALMLSGETAIGRDPPLVVRTMARIAERAEASADYRGWGARLGRVRQLLHPVDETSTINKRITDSITHAAWQAAADVDATAIICCTRTGRVARAMARYRPLGRLVAVSPDPRCLNALALSWGVELLDITEAESADDMVWLAVEKAAASGIVHPGDSVVVIAGAPDRASGAAADVMRIVRVR